MVRKPVAFTPPAEMTGEEEGVDTIIAVGRDGVEREVTLLPIDRRGGGDCVYEALKSGIDEISERIAEYTNLVAVAAPHDWIIYSGSEQVYGPDCTVLPQDAQLFVVSKVENTKLTPSRMTVSEMVGKRDAADYPVMYRVV